MNAALKAPILHPVETLEPQAWLSGDAGDLANIYQPQVNLAVWQGSLQQALGPERAACLQHDLTALLQQQPGFRFSLMASQEQALQRLLSSLPADIHACRGLAEYLQLTLELFLELFEPAAVSLRLQSLRGAMCPRFHVDHVPVRLVTTLLGPATEWLPEAAVCRSALGAGGGDPCLDSSRVARMASGDLALLKGSGWIGNEDNALVHRSPALADQPRLFLSIDFAAAES